MVAGCDPHSCHQEDKTKLVLPATSLSTNPNTYMKFLLRKQKCICKAPSSHYRWADMMGWNKASVNKVRLALINTLNR